ncbi:LOW QUALITY PROTEIN: protein ERGIC-53 [Homalodisca vitripennis]|uniref:L-type lectin-like domain-containing protein n=1 Tax=Homalodisca liturata TaxID=320908 RepID=A0A1B6I0V0_9HEMI|nr:LOW QUALITY PROTEIN: protein ERGIC-53 [Homalodisca vitripennis]
MAAEVRWLYSIVLCFLVRGFLSNTAFQRFEYKYSFKPPYLAQKDGKVPFWEYGGNAIASSQNVRVAPSLRSQKGAIWSKLKTNFQWWEVDILFRVTGRGRIGADGLAFWFTQEKGDYDGEVFGSSDKWVGLGVFFDSFDNDNKHNNPYIMAVVNDGSRQFDHANDGGTQMVGGCLRDFRNKPFPTRAKIEYYMGTLTVMFHNGNTNNEADMEVCLRVEGITLPTSGHFGLSAATGGLADDHDVLHFLTTSLFPPGATPQPGVPGQVGVSPEDHEKLAKEYADYQRKLDQQKEDYRKEHPEVAKDDGDLDEWYESDNQRELRQIFAGQSQVFEQVRVLSQKLDEVIGRQERTLSLLSNIQSGIPAPQIVQVPGGQQQVIGETIRRHEVDHIILNQNKLILLAEKLRDSMSEVMVKSDNIISNQARAPTAQVQSVGYDMVSLVNELRDGINSVKRDAAATAQKLVSPPPSSCPNLTCVSLPIFIFVAVVQLLCYVGYSVYKDNKEAQAKKFY